VKIKIIDVPPGESPYWVRKEIVGLELKTADEETIREILENMKVSAKGMERFFIVYMKELREAADNKNLTDVVMWLKDIDTPYGIFMFDRTYCSVLS
jgi:hypothetical protein